MPKSTKSAKQVSAEPVVKHSIPTAGDRHSSRVADRFRKKVKPNSPAVKDKDRAVIDIDDDTQRQFIEYACVKEVFDLVEAEKSTRQKDVSGSIYERFVDALWQSKTQPQNPAIKAFTRSGKVDAEGQFIVSGGAKIKINMPEVKDEEQPEDALVRGLVDLGIDLDSAERLVTNEVSFVPQWSLNFTDMMRGQIKAGKITPPTQTELTASEILFCAINGEDLDGNPLDANSRTQLLKNITEDGWVSLRANVDERTTYLPTLVDSADFLDRVCNYASTREELGSILTMFTPVYYCSRVKFAVEDSAEEKKERMVEEAKSILGVL
jgi:hypothetical protein